MLDRVQDEIRALLRQAGVEGEIELTTPPNPEMGDFSFPCFTLAKAQKKNPAEAAKEIHSAIRQKTSPLIEKVEFSGPYVNFFLKAPAFSSRVLKTIHKAGDAFGSSKVGKKQKVIVEYGCPNPLKTFHLGHLRNLITGEGVARVLENTGHKVVRTNYQGDVGMHVAKTLWAIDKRRAEYESIQALPLADRVAFLGRAYAYGATEFEKNETVKKEIEAYNEKVYTRDASIRELYAATRQWSLEYFETIYRKLGTTYDRYYFESDMDARGVSVVRTFLKKGVFATGEGGAIIYPGSKYGLHDRVFINSKGYPTYEAKDVALAERHFKDVSPGRVIHVVGKEQAEYFKVVFKAIEEVVPKSAGKEFHLAGGYLQLKGDVKMSSRTGNVITGDALIAAVEERVHEIMTASKVADKDAVAGTVAIAALKYAMLKSGVSDDMAFDMEASVGTEGDSGPYLLYIVARIKSILRKAEGHASKVKTPAKVEPAEKQLVLALAEFPKVAAKAAENLDPSYVAQYVFTLAQRFNTFYHACPVLQAEGPVRDFRLSLIQAVLQTMTNGLRLLGINTVEEM